MLVLLLLLGGCTGQLEPPGPPIGPAAMAAGAFVMPDGMSLPYRAWLPAGDGDGDGGGDPWAVALALHGMNDSRDAWEYSAPDFAAAGVAVFAPDQRGFGATATRGFWPGEDALAEDAREMARLLRGRYPRAKLFLMGESMGAAVLIHLATMPDPPKPDGYILTAPAVWGRTAMNPAMRAALWLAANLTPGLELTGRGMHITASDNRAALIRLSTDPLTLRATRVDTLRGLVDLMDTALAAAAAFPATPPTLALYGGRDEVIPPPATAITWRELAPGVRRAFYPGGYHLLLRDLGRAAPIGDTLAWIRDPNARLPSGADLAAARWLDGRR